ncbi:hypothetical protein SNE40_015545 [Patella caerulea]
MSVSSCLNPSTPEKSGPSSTDGQIAAEKTKKPRIRNKKKKKSANSQDVEIDATMTEKSLPKSKVDLELKGGDRSWPPLSWSTSGLADSKKKKKKTVAEQLMERKDLHDVNSATSKLECLKIGSSGDGRKNVSSGDGRKIGSSGDGRKAVGGSYSRLQQSIGQGDSPFPSSGSNAVYPGNSQQHWSQRMDYCEESGRPITGRTNTGNPGYASKQGGRSSPHGGRNSPHGGRNSPHGYRNSTHGGHGGRNSPHGGHGGRNSPHGGQNSPLQYDNQQYQNYEHHVKGNHPQVHGYQHLQGQVYPQVHGYHHPQGQGYQPPVPGYQCLDQPSGQGQGYQHNQGHQSGQGYKRQGRQNNKNFQQKYKTIKFERYWSKQELADGLKRQELIEGQIRINPKNYEDAYVPLPDGSCDIYICGMKSRNRALNGDIVAVQILDRDTWKVYENDLEKYETDMKSEKQYGIKGDNSDDENSGPDVVLESEEIVDKEANTKVKVESSPVQNKDNSNSMASLKDKTNKSETPKKKYLSIKDVLSSGSSIAKDLINTDVNQSKASSFVQKVGKVVGILEKKHSRAASGHIKLLQDKSKELALFSPFDHRLPRILLPMDECPKDFYERPEDHASTLFIARIIDWEEDSQYAKGQLTRSLGEAGLIEPETEALLIEYDVDFSEFTDETLACLPQNLPWKIPANEFEYRRDFRKECIFTIDPATARDLDDAVSCKTLGNGMYEVGVHIADVSFFIDSRSALDKVAAERATSVYLTQKVIPMLPRLLCEQLCSLNPDEDRLAFSVCWKMNDKGEIFEEWFGRSVIRSCVKLSYNHAQGFIDSPDKAWTAEELPPISEGFTVEDIKNRTLILHKISSGLREARFDNGALRLDQVKLQFTLDKDTGLPNGYTVYQQRESNRLIEEFMLLANMAVAHKINSEFPDTAILRCHPPPQSKMIEDLQKTCEELGMDMKVSSSQAIHESILKYVGNDEFSVARKQVLVALCSKPMQNAKYFCTGMYDDEENYRHYALNVPLYTHFTSPIRRYPDVMVHRLLAAALGYCEPPSDSKEDRHKEANHCNDKKMNAKRCSETSNDIFFAVFVKEAGPFEERGMVMAVLDRAFDVFILKLGVIKRVYCDKLEIKDKIFDKGGKVPKLTLLWPVTEDCPQVTRQEITIFSLVDCLLKSDMEPLKWTAYIKRPKENTPC